ncbi:MAG: ADP-glyceromanno-heptose 6-epimerase [Marinilabiliales bacterium]|jgi:ADP-L-glycero-D-manno-heptose 6-epimerase|nr:MAG: ADP-glyceromanno-heptose 6-epimerase [Marinilabiliales bacterium]
MIVITGAAGFIGSVLVKKMNLEGRKDLILVDDFSRDDKNKNLENKIFEQKIHRDDFFQWFDQHHQDIHFVLHIGARTDTTEFNKEIFDILNLNYSKQVWHRCAEYKIPLIYASSAATYGMGEFGYKDDHNIVEKLKPLNPYGESKNDFDKWVLTQTEEPPFWAGLKFFNVYGPNEYHKGRMASVIMHAFNQVKETGKVKLFKSHNPDFKNGEQLRDFVYVKDVADVIYFLMNNRPDSGLYNLGTGKAKTFLDLANATFNAMKKAPVVEFIDTPEDIREKYQYFTEADMSKLFAAGYDKPFYSLRKGIDDYVKNYLSGENYL